MTGPALAAAVVWGLLRPPRAAAQSRPPLSPRLARVLWCAILGAAVVVERYGVERPGAGWTLTETVQRSWRTDTPAGRWIFRAAWAFLAGWLPWHIASWRPPIQGGTS